MNGGPEHACQGPLQLRSCTFAHPSRSTACTTCRGRRPSWAWTCARRARPWREERRQRQALLRKGAEAERSKKQFRSSFNWIGLISSSSKWCNCQKWVQTARERQLGRQYGSPFSKVRFSRTTWGELIHTRNLFLDRASLSLQPRTGERTHTNRTCRWLLLLRVLPSPSRRPWCPCRRACARRRPRWTLPRTSSATLPLTRRR